MKLAEVYLIINGHPTGPVKVVLPIDVRGDDVVPDVGDVMSVMIRTKPTGSPLMTHGPLKRVFT